MSRNQLEKTGAGVYVLLGACAVLWHPISSIFEHLGLLKGHTDLLLPLALDGIGLLLVGLGVERLVSIQTLMEVMDALKQTQIDTMAEVKQTRTDTMAEVKQTRTDTMAALKNDGRFRCLDTPGKIYREALDMVMESSNHRDIKATDLWPSALEEKEDSNFIAYVRALADKIKQATREKGRVNYRLVYARDPNGFYKARLDHRRAQIADEHLMKRHVDNTFPLEVLIVGSSILIGFPDADVGKPLKFAIAISDAKLAPLVDQWYDDLVFNKAKKEPPNRASNAEETRIDK